MDAKTTSAKATAGKANANTIDGTLKNLETIADKKPFAVSTQAMVNSIIEAAGFGKKALLLELATGIALFTEANGVSRDSKQALQKIYVQAGFDAEDQFKSDYKTVRRRIDASAELYDWIGQDIVENWMGKSREKKAITNIIDQLNAQYDIRGINSVFALVGKEVTLKREPKAQEPTQPSGGPSEQAPQEAQAGSAQAPTGAAASVAAMVGEQVQAAREKRGRRADDIEGSVIISTEHLRVSIPPDVSKSEILELSMLLLELVNTLEVGEDAPKKEVVTH